MGRDVKATSIYQVKLSNDDIISDKLKISKAFNEHFVSRGFRSVHSTALALIDCTNIQELPAESKDK